MFEKIFRKSNIWITDSLQSEYLYTVSIYSVYIYEYCPNYSVFTVSRIMDYFF